jgi:PKD repeat protein
MTRRLLVRLRRDESGQALILALSIIVVGMLLALGAVAYALNVSGSASHDERTRGAQQAADAGVQTQLFDQSDSNALGYNLNNNAVLGVANLLECVVPEINLGQVVGTIQLGVSNGPCPSAVPLSCASDSTKCTSVPAPWSPVSNQTWAESETYPNAQLQGGTGNYAVLFPEIVSLGCKTTDPTNGAATCNAPASAAAKRNSYSRQLAVVQPTAPLQAIEGENDVTVTAPGLLGAILPTSIIDGNIVAGHNVTVPNVSVPANLSGASLPSALVGVLSGQISALTGFLGGLRATLSYGDHCNTTTLLGISLPDSCGSTVGAGLGLFSLNKTSNTDGSANQCTAGNPSTNCWLKRPAFNASALTNAGGPACPAAANISYSPAGSGGCNNGFLSATGTVTLTAPGTYVFCNVNVGGQLQSTGSGSIQIYVVGPGQDGCSNGLVVAGTAKVDSTSSTTLVGPAGTKIDFTDASSGGTTPYGSVAWSFGDGVSQAGTAGGTVNHTYTAAGTYYATETVTDAAGLSASYTYTVIITGPALAVGTPTCTISAASGVLCTGTATGGTPATSGYVYTWNFGDNGSAGDGSGSGTTGTVSTGAITGNTTSGLATTGFKYKTPGTYVVSYTVTDSTGASKTATATVTDAPLTLPAATAVPAAQIQGAASTFTGATAAGGLGGYTYGWNFGDNSKGVVTAGSASGALSSASVPAVSYQYANPGTYVAVLTVTSADGQTAVAYVKNIVVTAPIISGNGLTLSPGTIAVSVPTGPPSLSTKFTYTTGGLCLGTYSYSWNFGDGSALSSTQSPTHTYATVGIYQAQLTVTCSLLALIPLNEAYVANVVVTPSSTTLIPFSASAATGVPPSATTSGSTVTFTGSVSGGTGMGYGYSWNYGDGTSGTGSPASHTYSSAGIYTAVMTASDSKPNSTAYDVTVNVASASGSLAPTVSATLSPTGAVAPGTSVAFTAKIDGGTSPYASYTWNFGDLQPGTQTPTAAQTQSAPSPQTTGGDLYGPTLHTYTSAGTYLATLTVRDGAGLVSNTVYVPVTVSPTAAGASTGGNFVASGGVNQLITNSITGLLNGVPISTNSVDPSAFQIYMQGNPSDNLTQGTLTTNPSGVGGANAPTTYASIGGLSTVLDAFVIYAPRSNVSVTTQVLGLTGGVFEGSAIGWNTNINALAVLQDLDLGNYPLSSVINAYQVAQTVQCDASVVPLKNTSADLNGCT